MSEKKQGYRIQDTGYKNRASCIVHHVSCIVHRASCIMNQTGFTLVELMITMVVFVLVIAAASQIFTGLLTQFKQQSKMAETNIEGIVGLDIMRRDIEHAGYGLPWNVTGVTDSDSDGNLWDELTNYLEADSIGCTPNPADFNDASATTPGPPRAIFSSNNASFSGCGANSIFNGSDYLVIKSTNVASNNTAQRWTRLGPGTNNKRDGLSGDTFAGDTDRVIVISPGSSATNSRSLVVSGGAFYTTYNSTDGFAPSDATDTRIIYGVDGDTNLRMPFNRADYYIWRNSTSPATDEVPDRCAPNTGVLRKAVINQSNGQRENPLPLLDCVADMQVVFGIDTDTPTDGAVNCYVNNLANAITVDSQNIRDRIREVRVYILAHEGQFDRNFIYGTNSIRLGEDLPRCAPGATDEAILGRNRDISSITNWQNYRWKVYTIVVKPNNLE